MTTAATYLMLLISSFFGVSSECTGADVDGDLAVCAFATYDAGVSEVSPPPPPPKDDSKHNVRGRSPQRISNGF